MQDLIIVIPARRNSKSIPFKNRQKINGINIVDYAIQFSQKVNPSEIILSTDDEYFFQKEEYKNFIHKRPSSLATDETIISDVMLQIINERNLQEKFILLLEPTCFPRYLYHLEPLMDGTFLKSGSRCLASFTNTPIIKEKIWSQKKGKLISDPLVWNRRQDFPAQFILTGHYYGFYGKDLYKYYPGLCDENVFPIIIKDKYIDINTFDDLEKLKYILNNKRN